MYIRTSTDKQCGGLESQERALREFCLKYKDTALELFEDSGISGAKLNRPSLDRLMSAVREGHIQAVVVYSFSRFARSTSHLLAALEEFNKLNVKFVSVSENLDTSTAVGTALFTIIGAIAELEREIIRERVVNGLKNARAKGKKLGRTKTRNSHLIRELAKQTYSQREIAKLVGCSKTTVMRELREAATELQK